MSSIVKNRSMVGPSFRVYIWPDLHIVVARQCRRLQIDARWGGVAGWLAADSPTNRFCIVQQRRFPSTGQR
jgi:hypothetical protein